MLNDFLDRLLEAIPEPVTISRSATDEEVMAALLANPATDMFANSEPCWMHEEETKCLATTSGV
jgi:hypothetical protein